jgi:hypothetical protein
MACADLFCCCHKKKFGVEGFFEKKRPSTKNRYFSTGFKYSGTLRIFPKKNFCANYHMIHQLHLLFVFGCGNIFVFYQLCISLTNQSLTFDFWLLKKRKPKSRKLRPNSKTLFSACSQLTQSIIRFSSKKSFASDFGPTQFLSRKKIQLSSSLLYFSPSASLPFHFRKNQLGNNTWKSFVPSFHPLTSYLSAHHLIYFPHDHETIPKYQFFLNKNQTRASTIISLLPSPVHFFLVLILKKRQKRKILQNETLPPFPKKKYQTRLCPLASCSAFTFGLERGEDHKLI